MLRFDSIRVHNVGPFADVDVDLSALPRIVAVTGGNGQGKSTLLELLAGALYRECPTRGPLAGLARGRDAFVEVGCTNGVPRTLRQTLDAVSGKSEALVLDEGRRPVLPDTKVRSFDAWAGAHLPSPEVLYASTFGVQGSAGFLELKAGERKAVLLRVLGIERLERMAERARERRREALSTVDRLTAALAEVRGGSVDEAQEALERATGEHAAAELRVTATAQAVERVRAEVQRIGELARQAASALADRERIERELTAARTLAADLEKRATNNRELIARADEIREALARWRALGEEIDAAKADAESAYRAARDASDTVARLETDERQDRVALGHAKRRREELRERLGARAAVEAAVAAAPGLSVAVALAEDALTAARTRLDVASRRASEGMAPRVVALREALAEIGGCREDSYDIEQIEAVAAAALAEDDAAAARETELPATIEKARADERAASQALLAAQRERAEAERAAAGAPAVAAAEAALGPVEAEIARLDERLAKVPFLLADAMRARAEVRAAHERIEARAAAARDERAALGKAEAQAAHLAHAEARLAELEPQLLAAGERIAALRMDLDLLMVPSVPARPDIEHAERALRDALDARARAESAVSVAQHRLDDAIAAGARRADLSAQVATAQADLADWTRLSTDLGRDGLQALEIDAAGPELSALANDLLHTCVGPRWTITIDTQRLGADGRLLESLDVRVLDTEAGREANVETFSGGERVLLGEAVSLALSMLACRASGMTGSTIIRDESGAALDAEKGPAYVAMLRRAADVVGARQVLIVTHSADVAALCDARLVVADGKVEVARG